jgi:hypothetical protein
MPMELFEHLEAEQPAFPAAAHRLKAELDALP